MSDDALGNDAASLPGAGPADDLASSLLEASTEHAIVAVDTAGHILLWNSGASRLYGHPAASMVGRANIDRLFVEEDLARGLPATSRTEAVSAGTWEGNVAHLRADGSRFSARMVLTPRRRPDGALSGFLLICNDVSKDIRLTEELEATQAYTRSLIESNIDALMTTDLLGVITDVNEQMVRLTGHGRAELIGTPFKRYFTDPGLAEEGIRLALTDGSVTNYELTARHVDGAETVVSYNATTFLDQEGRLEGVFAAARDVTKHKALEERLRRSESYNRGLIEASVDGLITVEPDGLISDVNEQMCRMTGFLREELIGTPFADYFVDPAAASVGVTETFDKGVVTGYVLALARRDSAELKVSFNASVFRTPEGQVQGIFASARDITEQDRLQSQLSAEREYNRGLIEASLDGLITVDPMLRISDVNETMCRMAGYGRSELIGSPFDSYFTDARRAAAGVRLTLDKGEVTNYQLVLRAKDGGESLVSFNASVFRTSEGEVQGIFASARDITVQAGLQDQLAEEQAYNRGLIEASVDGLVTVDQDMVITDVNETMAAMVGRRRSQLIGSSFPEYFTERTLAAEGVRLTFSEGQVTNYVLTLEAADGRALPVSFNAATYTDTSGEVRGIFASARDITDQQGLEQRLREQQSYTRSLIESNVDALMTTDPLGIITDVNGQMEDLTGCSRTELVGSPFKRYFTDPDAAEAGIRLVLHEAKVTDYELTAQHQDGHTTVVSYNAATFFDQDGRLEGVFAAARTVSAQKELEGQLREQQTYLRGLIESSVDGLVTVDPEGYISDVNDRMCSMTGFTRAELIGSRFADYFTDADEARRGVQQTFESGVVTEYALTIVSRTRRHLRVSFNASVFTDADGAVRGIFASARDITDRVRLEDQLREQQTYLRGLIESSVDGLVTVDPDGYVTDVNEQMCRMSGYSREQLIGSPFKQYFTDQEKADTGVKQTLAKGIVTNYELVLTSQSGRKATVSFNASVFRTADGHIEGIFASARDISEQARLQLQLVEHQAYNRSLIEASADALFAIAPDGVITDVNEEATRLTGFSRRHLMNSRFSEYFTEPALATAGVQQTFSEGRVLGYELTTVTRQGRRLTVSFNAGVFTDAAGNALGILASARDITAQKALERQLRDSQVYTRSLIESNIDALMTTDPLGLITDVNGQMEALTGLSRDKLVGSPFKQYFTDPDAADAGIRQVLREGRVTNYELTARHHDGHETVVSYNASTFQRDGRLQGVFAAARDVTDRKRFELTLQEKNVELESASRAKDKFLSSMSHELRTPLNAILGFTGTLLMGLPGPVNDEQQAQLGTVRSSARHLLSIINDLLDLAKIESGKVELTLGPVSCRDVVEEVLSTLAPLASAKGLRFTAALPEQDLLVHADRRALHQILINLANNAIKCTEQGSVTIEVRPEHSATGERTLVQVVDTGIGIRDDDQKRLFTAFAKLDAGHPKETEGTGLGLYICERLATLIDGELSFASTYGTGSTFGVALREA